jgi:hypothetical protein
MLSIEENLSHVLDFRLEYGHFTTLTSESIKGFLNSTESAPEPGKWGTMSRWWSTVDTITNWFIGQRHVTFSL